MGKTIEVNSAALMAVLTQLHDRTGDMSPVLRAIGGDMVERIKQRFATATGPDGTPWAPNTQVTLITYLQRRSGHYAAFSHLDSRKRGSARVGDKNGYFLKDGSLSKKSQTLLENKRPLQGESGDLARQFFPQVTPDSLTVGSTMIYAAMQQYGGSKAQFPNLWGNIPARPFFPIKPDGTLYPQEENAIVDRLRQYLTL